MKRQTVNVEFLISERLKIPTVQRQLFNILKQDINSIYDIKQSRVREKIYKLDDKNKKSFLICLAGPIFYKEAESILYENII